MLFVELQTCEKFSIDPYEYVFGDKWNSPKGQALKYALVAHRLLTNEEEQRQYDEIKNKK